MMLCWLLCIAICSTGNSFRISLSPITHTISHSHSHSLSHSLSLSPRAFPPQPFVWPLKAVSSTSVSESELNAIDRQRIAAVATSGTSSSSTSLSLSSTTTSSSSASPSVSSSSTQQSRFSLSDVLTGLSIVALVLQNSCLSLTMRMSRITGRQATTMYAASTAVLVSELIKFIISYMTYHSTHTGEHKLSLREIASDVPMLIQVAIPSGLYVLQNNLQYLAMSSLPAAIYQVLVQMKIITAAFLSKIYLDRAISVRQWESIIALTVGVIVVQLSTPMKSSPLSNMNLPLGLLAVGLSCFTSGYAGVKLESTLKDKNQSLWVRNLQISIVSILVAAIACLKDLEIIRKNGFFSGYTPLVLLVILIQAIGGILVSLVVKNTSTIVKGFATAASIIFTSFVSAIVLSDVKINGMFLIGALIVCISTIAYST